jgi:glycosyltransferase involved in cell wall biosynthesis
VELSVVLACKNEARHLGTMLGSLARQSWEGSWEVVVADNGSTDETRSVAQGFSTQLPRLRVIDASERLGAAYARNRGVERSSGAKILFLDGDDEVNDNYIAAMSTALDEYPLVSAQIEHERLNPQWALKVRPDRVPGVQEGGLPAEFGFLPYAGGGAMGIWRSVFDEVGGFRLRPTFEEADLCWRVQLAGYPGPVFADEAILHYRLPHDLRSEFRRGRDYMHGQLALFELYRDQGMSAPQRITFRHIAGALKRIGTIEGAALTAATLGRLIGQLTDFPMF